MARPRVLVGVTLWRLLIVAFSFVGFGLMAADHADPLDGLSQLASVLAGLVYLGLAAYPLLSGRLEPASPWLRGAVAVLLVLVSGTFLTVLDGDLSATWSLLEHLLTPLLVVVDWVFVGRNQANAKWWYPLSWVVFPLAYLIYFLAADLRLYRGLLDPQDGAFLGTVAGFLVGVIATGYVLYGVAKLKEARQVEPARWSVR